MHSDVLSDESATLQSVIIAFVLVTIILICYYYFMFVLKLNNQTEFCTTENLNPENFGEHSREQVPENAAMFGKREYVFM